MYRHLVPLRTAALRQQLNALLRPETGRNLTRPGWLVQPDTASNPAAIAPVLDKRRYLNGVGV